MDSNAPAFASLPVRPSLRMQLVAARDRLGFVMLAPAVAPACPTWLQAGAAVALLSVAAIVPAFAQDTIGITPVSTAVIAAFKLLGLIGIGWGFIRLMGGRHTIEGLLSMAIGGLGLAKADAVAALFGLA